MRSPLEWPTRDLLSHRVAVTPDRTAVVDVERDYSYERLDAIVDHLAVQLRASATGTPSRIGALVSTRFEFVTLFHASLRLGCEFVPLGVTLAEREVRDRLDRVDPDLLVCEAETETVAVSSAACPVATVDIPDTDGLEPLDVSQVPGTSVQPATWDRHQTAVILFTSGTTGEPKAVRLTLGNLVASATASAFRLGVGPDDRWLCCLPTHHMGGLAPICRCPLYGTTLLLQPEFDRTATARRLRTAEVTGVSLVPTQLKRLLDGGWHPADSLQTVLLGGAPATPELVERALNVGVPVAPTYGLTETASQVATATPQTAGSHPDSVGQPLVFTDVTVVDEDGTPVSRGSTGELVVSGPTVTPGYLDEERTADAFGEHGFHTRDVGYRDDAGRVWVLGRADDLIITGGENVHPTEVRSVVRDHPSVVDAAVVGIPDPEWGERVGALVATDESDLTGQQLRAFVDERLASYKVPKTTAVVSSLPRTASGTVDRNAVRDRLESE